MIFCSSVNTITKFTQKIPSNNYATAAERTSQQQSNLICDKREKYFALEKKRLPLVWQFSSSKKFVQFAGKVLETTDDWLIFAVEWTGVLNSLWLVGKCLHTQSKTLLYNNYGSLHDCYTLKEIKEKSSTTLTLKFAHTIYGYQEKISQKNNNWIVTQHQEKVTLLLIPELK